MSLRVEFAFDRNFLAGYGYTEDDVIRSIKAAYAKYGIRCATEKPVLSFVGRERNRLRLYVGCDHVPLSG